ncbi:MAG: TolC family protein [Planctomycetota bacterium]|jgi:outer membrane protein TolC
MTDRSVLMLIVFALALGGCQSSPSDDDGVWMAASPPGVEAGATPPEDKAGVDKVQTRRDPSKPVKLEISVEGAVSEALEANRTIQLARLNEAIARTIERETRAGLLPSLFFRGTYTTQNKVPTANIPGAGGPVQLQPQNEGRYAVSLDFPIFAFGRYINAYRSSQLSRQGAEADTDASEAQIGAAVTAAAYDLLLTIQAVGVARDNEEALLQQVKDSEALLEAGRVTRSALLEAQVLHDNARREREKAGSLVAIKRMTLNEILGRPPSLQTEIADQRDVEEPRFDLGLLTAEALERRPELKSARLDVEAAVRSAKAVLGQALPELRGAFAYSQTDNQIQSPRDIGSFALTLDIPLYVGGANYARIQRARRLVETARVQLIDLEANIQTEVADAFRTVRESYLDIAVGKRSIERSQENLRIQREKFANGRATSQEVLQSTSLLTDSRFNYISAIYSYKNALRELHRVRGGDPRTKALSYIPETELDPGKPAGEAAATPNTKK